MPRMKVGVRLESFRAPIKRAVELAAAAGAHGVVFDAVGELSPSQLSQTGRRDLQRLFRIHELELMGVGAPTRHGYDCLERLEGRVANTIQAISLASQLRAPLVINHVGAIPAEADSPIGRAFDDALDRIGREAERQGPRFALDPGVNAPETMEVLLTRKENFGLALLLDPAGLIIRNRDLGAVIRQQHRWLVGAAVKDIIRSTRSVTGYEEIAWGQGELDGVALLGHLIEVDVVGALILDRRQAPDAPAVARDLQALLQLTQGLS